MPSYYEFFAGGGMARAGLGNGWRCLFANDIDAKKGASYATNWGREVLEVKDIGEIRASDLPGRADLAWASFPCQDLSLAGEQAGLNGDRSGTFWLFWNLIKGLVAEGRTPEVIVLENVCGALTSHGGRDFAAIGGALVDGGYRFGALVIDAIHFVPQSRPRLFIVAIRNELSIPNSLTSAISNPHWHPANLVSAQDKLQRNLKIKWIWWKLPPPPQRKSRLADIIEFDQDVVHWHTASETERLLEMMSEVNRRKVANAIGARKQVVGTVYRRTRSDHSGTRRQRAEIRFDEVAGCLRTPVGGSSRQTVMIIDGSNSKSRLLTPRETARLMGLCDGYALPAKQNDAYHLTGDGVVVPVVRFLASHILESLVHERSAGAKQTA